MTHVSTLSLYDLLTLEQKRCRGLGCTGRGADHTRPAAAAADVYIMKMQRRGWCWVCEGGISGLTCLLHTDTVIKVYSCLLGRTEPIKRGGESMSDTYHRVSPPSPPAASVRPAASSSCRSLMCNKQKKQKKKKPQNICCCCGSEPFTDCANITTMGSSEVDLHHWILAVLLLQPCTS